MKSTLERGLKVLEIAEREALKTRLDSDAHPFFWKVHSFSSGQHHFGRLDKGIRNVTPRSIIAFFTIQPALSEDCALQGCWHNGF
jgi:hypothetical protein